MIQLREIITTPRSGVGLNELLGRARVRQAILCYARNIQAVVPAGMRMVMNINARHVAQELSLKSELSHGLKGLDISIVEVSGAEQSSTA